MARARRLAWIGGGAAVAAIVIAAVLALPDVDPAPPAPRPAGPAPDAAAPVPPRAPDEPASEGDVAQAARMVASARVELAAGHLAQARTLFARAHALDPQPATLLQLAEIDLQTGRCREARRAVQRVIAEGAGELSSQAWGLMQRIGRCD